WANPGLSPLSAPTSVEIPDPTPRTTVSEEEAGPPPVPRVSLMRRLLAAVVDQVFVLCVWLVALVITANLFSSGEGFSVFPSIAAQMNNPIFQRFGMLEFAGLWLAYFILWIGLLEMTFGMWVWGIRISFGQHPSEPKALGKFLRIVASFVFYAP